MSTDGAHALALTGVERQARILEAAARAFAAHGYHAASMREIAHLAGITKPILYDHFTSKEQLYVALIESVRDEVTSATSALMGATGPLESRFRNAIEAFFHYVEARPAEAKVLFMPPEGEPTVVEAARATLGGCEMPRVRFSPDVLGRPRKLIGSFGHRFRGRSPRLR